MTSDTPDAPDAPDADRIRASLRRLAGADERTIIERADAATHDLEAAAEFVASVGLEELEAAVDAVDDPALAERGRRALAAFRRARAATAGDLDAGGDHFRPGRGTDLRGDDERPPG